MFMLASLPVTIAIPASFMWSSVFLAPIAVLIHRSIVLGERMKAGSYFVLLVSRRVARFILLGLFLYSMPLLLQTLTTILLEDRTAVAAVLGIAYYAVTIYILRFLFAFPAIATDQYKSLGEARALMKGSIIRVVLAMIVAIAPAFLVLFLVQSIRIEQVEQINTLRYAVVGLVLTPIFPAVISFAYRHRSGRLLGQAEAEDTPPDH